MRHLGDFGRYQWELRADDAQEYVREKYLYSREMSEAERENLLRVAVLSVYETLTPLEALNPHGLRESLRRGVVLRSEHGRNRWVRYRLVHPGLGRLMLDASGATAESPRVLCELVTTAPHCGGYLVNKLEATGKRALARYILEYLARSAEHRSALLTAGSLMVLKTNVERLWDYHFSSREETEAVLGEAGARKHLISEALFSPFNFLVAFLEYAERNLPGANETVKQALCAEENRETIQKNALKAPLDLLVAFLEYAERKLPGAYGSAKQAVCAKENRETIQKNALQAPLDLLVTFLDRAERNLPGAYESARQAVCATENRETIQKKALRAPLDRLVTFLDYAEGKLPGAYEAAKQAVCATENRGTIQKRALQAPLDSLGVALILDIDRSSRADRLTQRAKC
jgi:hypothetical protein